MWLKKLLDKLKGASQAHAGQKRFKKIKKIS